MKRVLVRSIRFFSCLLLIPILNCFAGPEVHLADRVEVKAYIQEMVKKYHFDPVALTALLNTVKVKPFTRGKAKATLEQKPWNIYRLAFVTEKRIVDGVAFWDQYAESLNKVESVYGVPAAIIVATIGVETKYGHRKGRHRVLDALANMAFSDAPNAKYFRRELTEFLLLSREQQFDPGRMFGSVMGAMGQPQFLPSSYRHYAVSFSGATTIDLTNNPYDIIASVANFYAKNGWQRQQPIALPLSLTGGKFQWSLLRPKNMSIAELSSYHIMDAKNLLPDKTARLLILQGNYGNEYWLSFRNFNVIKRYNHSDLYAMAVYQLSNYILVRRENGLRM